MKWLQGLETARTDEEKAHLVERLLKLKVILLHYKRKRHIYLFRSFKKSMEIIMKSSIFSRKTPQV